MANKKVYIVFYSVSLRRTPVAIACVTFVCVLPSMLAHSGGPRGARNIINPRRVKRAVSLWRIWTPIAPLALAPRRRRRGGVTRRSRTRALSSPKLTTTTHSNTTKQMYGHVEKLARQVKAGVDSVDGIEGVLYQVCA